jgi:hypothetical protein
MKKIMKVDLKILSALFLLIASAMISCDDESEVIKPQNGLVANAGEDKASKVNQEIVLDGSASYNKNQKSFTYVWSITTKPAASTALIASPFAMKASFTPDVAGLYIVELTLKQDSWTAKDQVILTISPEDVNTPTAVILNQNIYFPTTLNDIFENPAQPDYIVTNDIEVRADLVIMPGVVIAFHENKGMQLMNGAVRAVGTPDHGIIFKGLTDQPSYWKGIVIHSNNELNEFEFVTIKQAGSATFTETGVKANVTLAGSAIEGGALKISHTVFSESGGYGLYVQGTSTLNRFSNNAFLNNAFSAAYIPASQLHKIDVVSFTGTNGVETGGVLFQESEITWKKLTGSYFVTSDIQIYSGVSIDAGASFKMSSGITIQITDNGYLRAIGSAELRTVFTSSGNGIYWNGLYFNSGNQNNTISYCDISYAGMNKIAAAAHPANIVIGNAGTAIIEHSIIKNGLGYGLVTPSLEQVNEDLAQVNTFNNLQKGSVFPETIIQPELPPLTGIWVDQWTFNQHINNIADNYYNPQTGTWFQGAANPWAMNPAGFGIHFAENGNFTWTIAEQSPMTGCESWSAEYITGTTTVTPGTITFNQDYWRSKFINSCDETWNIDTEVTTSVISIPYKIEKMYNVWTYEEYWRLTFTNPDNSTFYYYRR